MAITRSFYANTVQSAPVGAHSGKEMRLWFSFGWMILLLAFLANPAFAGQVSLAWNASSGPVSGYKVYYGTASGNYASNLNVGNTTTATVASLADGSTYYFAVKAYDSTGNESGFSNEVSKPLTVAAPVASFSTDKTSGTAPVTVNLADTSTGTIASRTWDLGDGTTSTAQSVAKTYSAAGSYTVKLTVTNAGGSTTTTKTISVTTSTVAAPVASFSATPTSGAAPLLVTLTDTSTGTVLTRTWDLGDGTTSTSQSVAKTYNAAGSYTVKLTVTNAGGSTTTTKTISATASAPIANFSASLTSGTAPLVTTFSDTSTGSVTGWSWNFGDGTTSNVQNPPAHTYKTAGSYTVSLTVSGPGGTSAPKTMTVKANPSTTTLPAPWQDKDIGSVGLAGSASFANGTYTLKGAGADIWGSADAFNFAYQPLNGNGSIVARVASLTNTDSWAKAGVMIRESLDANARHAMVVVSSGNGVAFQRRTSTGGASEHTAGAAGAAPYWVKLVRSGNTFTAHQSANGTTWTQIGSPVTISMATSVYVGLALTSHNSGLLSTAKIDSVRVTSP